MKDSKKLKGNDVPQFVRRALSAGTVLTFISAAATASGGGFYKLGDKTVLAAVYFAAAFVILIAGLGVCCLKNRVCAWAVLFLAAADLAGELLNTSGKTMGTVAVAILGAAFILAGILSLIGTYGYKRAREKKKKLAETDCAEADCAETPAE